MQAHRVSAAVAVLAAVVAVCEASAASLDAPPTRVGACAVTTITRIGGRLEGDRAFQSGTAVQFSNGVGQVSYDKVPAIVSARVGDRVRMCLTLIPQGCPPGDDRGRFYRSTDLRSHGSWTLPDSQHMCGGA